MSAARKLYQPDARCPSCGAPARVAYTEKQLAKWADEPPGELVQTYQCHFNVRPRVKCNRIFAITAGSVQRATEM